MATTLYASFVDVAAARKAVGALLDKGVDEDHLTLVSREADYEGEEDKGDARAAERSAEKGITTTTPGDAASGAMKGGAVGLGVGALAAIASLVVPGFGLVVGGGALATAIGGALGTTAAGAVAGGAVGYLKDQGIEDHVAEKYAGELERGGALVSVDLQGEDEVSEQDVRWVFDKYEGRNVHSQPAGVPVM